VENLLTPKQAAEYLGIKPRTLEVHRYRGTGPTYCKIGRMVRYRQDDLIAYATQNVRTSTTDSPDAPASP